jgi:hypothetical protein
MTSIFNNCTDYNTTKSSSDTNVITVILATLVAVLSMSNALLFIIACVCGQKCKKLNGQPIASHEDWDLKITGVDEQDLELEMNVAYGHFSERY